MKIIKDVEVSSFNAYDWCRVYDMRSDYENTIQKWSHEKMKKFNNWLEEQTDELDEGGWMLEDYINEFEEFEELEEVEA